MNKDFRRRAARIQAAIRHSHLADRERLLIGAYLYFEEQHGALCERPGVCWPNDRELVVHLGCSGPTVRRARRELAHPSNGDAPLIAVEVVKPFHKLPNGATAWHGANVIHVLDVEAPPEIEGLTEATRDVVLAERRLARARAKVAELAAAARAEKDSSEAGEVPPGSSQHNAPLRITLACSAKRAVLAAGVGAGEGMRVAA